MKILLDQVKLFDHKFEEYLKLAEKYKEHFVAISLTKWQKLYLEEMGYTCYLTIDHHCYYIVSWDLT